MHESEILSFFQNICILNLLKLAKLYPFASEVYEGDVSRNYEIMKEVLIGLNLRCRDGVPHLSSFVATWRDIICRLMHIYNIYVFHVLRYALS